MFRQMTMQRLAVLCIAGAAVIAVLAGIFISFAQPQMDPLFTDLQEGDAAKIVTELESMDVPVRLSADGRTIYAPRDRISRLRMGLAEKGLPAGGAVGYEIFDEKNSLGLTSFMQDVSRLRALEGELSRTIQTLNDIESARVHLVLATRDPFSRDTAPPTASVVVRMRGALTLEARHAAAIRHLVASAVPRLTPSAVSVLDARVGVVFAEENGALAGASSVDGLRKDIEARLASAVESVLTPHLGPGRVRVRVAADLRTEREVRREERFDPDSTALRSRQVIDETERSRENTDENPVTVQQNLPEAGVDANVNARSQSEQERSEQLLNYEVSSVRSEQVIEPGEIERLSVSVLVDQVRETGPDGQTVLRARTPEEMARLENLVKSAVGFSGERGDVVTLESLPFANLDELMPPVRPAGVGEILASNLDSFARAAALLVLGLIFIFAVIRPAMDRAMPPIVREERMAATAASGEPSGFEAVAQLSDETGGEGEPRAVEDGGEEGERLALPKRPMNEALNSMLELRDVDGKVRASSVRKLGEIAEEYPDEVVTILRNWIYEDSV
ncbi:flagellar basal-body MS-ring/collar protein FliF [Hyphococcus sp.]|jgi:flagellar M-ring protein FliF|uniref:flagellar basal-body MS-ring/collar protein FliF n=1 Tax=Hyphococcus sp. TaxID=2038636 RepID=UPI003D107D0F